MALARNMAKTITMQRLARLIDMKPVIKASLLRLGAFEITVFLPLRNVQDVVAPVDQTYLEFGPDKFTDHDLSEIIEMARNGKDVVLQGNALPILKSRIQYPL